MNDASSPSAGPSAAAAAAAPAPAAAPPDDTAHPATAAQAGSPGPVDDAGVPPAAAAAAGEGPGMAAAPGEAAPLSSRSLLLTVAGLFALALLGLGWLALVDHGRLQALERDLVKRVQANAEHADEARLLARQAQDGSRENTARIALLDARLAEVALQRAQLDDLIASLSRSRDENAVADIDAAIRVAAQQAAIIGSVEPLVAALRSADERLTRINQPRLQAVRRALARDIDRARASNAPDMGSLLIRFDEAVRMVDELPLYNNPVAAHRGPRAGAAASGATAAAAAGPSASAASAAAGAASGAADAPGAHWWQRWLDAAQGPFAALGQALAELVRVQRIDQPEAMLLAPDQAYFLRENVKLRLLNARLALLSRQSDAAQTDVQAVLVALTTYFDPAAKRTQVAVELVRQLQVQTRPVPLPRPDESLAAIAAALAGH